MNGVSASLHWACDRTAAAAAPETARDDTPHPRAVLATTILASSLAFIDGSVVSVGLPLIGRSLAAAGGSLSWIVNGYLLPLSALLLIGGAVGDLYGRRRLLILGVSLFAIASVLCATAPNLQWLLAGRLLQGIGAAILMPNSLAILGSSFAGETRGQAIGIWAAAGAAAGAAGPLIGGWLIDQTGWRAIFFINVPLAMAAIILAALFVPDERDRESGPLDLAGATLAATGLAALTWGLTAISSAQGQPAGGLAALTGGAAILVLFVYVERRRKDAAMMPLALFASRKSIGLSLLTLLLYGALGGLLVLVPYVLIEASGYSATMAGAALLPLPLVVALASPAMGRLAGRIGPRLQLSIGPGIVAIGYVLAMRIGGPSGYWLTTFPAMLVIALGMACAVAPLTTAVLASVEPRHTGVASGFNSAVARTGGLIATALASTVLVAGDQNLLSSFRGAAVIGAVASVAAGGSAYRLMREG